MVELLAPAGSREAFAAAVESGANAVYLGGKLFGARQYAPNFTMDEMAEAVKFAHVRGVKVYVTVNTLVDDGEWAVASDYLRDLYDIGVDAAILQDFGVLRLAKRAAPNLPLHASTQMTAHNVEGVNLLAGLGFERAILARELSLDEISHICDKARCAVEVFIHGALCISYSGQCLMSSLIGGRSGNRGRCAQPCRLPYQLIGSAANPLTEKIDAGEYLLSPKDLQTIEIVPQLISAGIASFKIEGRMKRPEYVAIVTDAYRQAIDSYVQHPGEYVVEKETLQNLEQIFNRGFTTAHLFGKQGTEMMSDRRPNNRGVLAGRVIRWIAGERKAHIRLEAPLRVDDIVEAWVKVGGRVNMEVSSLFVDGVAVSSAEADSEVLIPCNEPVRTGDRVFKTFDIRLTERARALFNKIGNRRIAVDIAVTAEMGKPLTIEVKDLEGNCVDASTGFIVEAARKQPLTTELLETQCSRLGATPFILRNFTAQIGENVMAPISEINAARREALSKLEDKRLARFDRPPLPQFEVAKQKQVTAASGLLLRPELVVRVETPQQVSSALEAGADWIYLMGESFSKRDCSIDYYAKILEQTRSAGKRIVFGLPRILRGGEIDDWKELLNGFAVLEPDAVGVGNPGAWAMVREHKNLKIHVDYTMNIYNQEAIRLCDELGAISATLSPELTLAQVERLAGVADIDVECLVHGRIPMMISEFCAVGSYLGKSDAATCSGACSKGPFFLRDRKGEEFPVITDDACRMHILNAKELNMLPYVDRFMSAGVKKIRIEAWDKTPEETGKWTAFYRQALDSGKSKQFALDDAERGEFTRGHYFRGVL